MIRPGKRPSTIPGPAASSGTEGENVATRKPRLMVAGEFSAGKTCLINGLLGDRVLPSNVTATALPPIWLIGGDGAPLAVGLDGATREIGALSEAQVEDTQYCVVSHGAELLEHYEIIDTPGNSDPNIPSECWERMLDYADAVIWCTNATQAWRQSEKSVWNGMPERLLKNATLLITHADRITDGRSAEKLLRRVRREADKYFQTVLIASLLDSDHLSEIRGYLDATMGDLDSLDGAPCAIISGRADPATPSRTEAAHPVAPRRVVSRSRDFEPAPDTADEGDALSAEASAAEREHDDKDIDPVIAVAPGGPPSEPAVEAEDGSEVGLEELAKALLSDAQNPEAEDKPDGLSEDPAGDVLVLQSSDSVPDASARRDGSARTLWNALSRKVDTTDAAAVRECVEDLLSALDEWGEAREDRLYGEEGNTADRQDQRLIGRRGS